MVYALKLARLSVLLAAVFAVSLAQDPFTPYLGFYVPVGEQSVSMRNVANFAVISASSDRVQGRVVPKEGAVHNFTTAHIGNGDIDFKTARVKSVSYEFHGHFLQAPPFPEDGKTVILEGKLKTYRNGALSGESAVRLTKSSGGGE